MSTMRAIVKKERAPGLVLEDVPVPQPGINDVRIRVLRASICGTDLHIYEWDAWAQRHIEPPLVIGHEFVGVVDRVGEGVEEFGEGDLVTAEGHIVCGHCRNCLAGRRHLCNDTQGVGVSRAGAFAEYIVVPAENLCRFDPAKRIPLGVLSCFDPLGNAVHTALEFPLLAEDVLITGAGPIGMMAIAVAKHAGARHVVVTDVDPFRLELAAKMKPTRAVNVGSEKISDVVTALGMKEGFDVGLEMSGNPKALNDTLAVMRHGGTIALLGILPNDAAVDWDRVIFKGLTLQGIYGREMFETWYKMTTMIECGLDITPIITDELDSTEFESGFRLMAEKKCGKVVLRWGDL